MNIMYMTLKAIKHIHKKGIYHRDIKPENILIDSRQEKLKIIDFGLARNVTETYESKNIIAGTSLYMPPEVDEGRGSNESYSPAGDIFVLGNMMYYLFSGILPFDGSDVEENVCEDFVSFPDDLWMNVDVDGRFLISEMLKKKPHKRITAEKALNHDFF